MRVVLTGTLAGMLLASAISRPLHRAGGAPTVREWARTGSRSAFVLQAVAYAANDGQKLFVVPILAGIATPLLPAAPRVTAGLIVAVPFAAGAIFGVRRFATTIGSLVRQAPDVTLVSSSASAAMVLGTAALGFPVSMTQTTAGAQVGASITTGVRRIRWDIALRLLQAWVLTLPAAFAVGVALGRAVIR
jgi:PiT family inorganic phosphate transporter